jgi:hypothetical protein
MQVWKELRGAPYQLHVMRHVNPALGSGCETNAHEAEITLGLTVGQSVSQSVSQSVCLDVGHPFRAKDQIFFFFLLPQN